MGVVGLIIAWVMSSIPKGHQEVASYDWDEPEEETVSSDNDEVIADTLPYLTDDTAYEDPYQKHDWGMNSTLRHHLEGYFNDDSIFTGHVRDGNKTMSAYFEGACSH